MLSRAKNLQRFILMMTGAWGILLVMSLILGWGVFSFFAALILTYFVGSAIAGQEFVRIVKTGVDKSKTEA